MFTFKLGLLFFFYLSASAEDGKWVWGDNSRNNNERSVGLRYEKSADPRYNVYENENDYNSNRPNIPPGFINNRPQAGFINNRPQYNNPGLEIERPFQQIPGPIYNRPNYPGPGLVGNRPGGVYGNGGIHNGGYGQGGRPIGRPENYPDDPRDPGILTGPIPSWVKEGPFKNYDTCRCTEKFNCRSPGISYGHCDVGKKYCCYNRNKAEDLGSDFPTRPIHSPENGVLVGPGGPVGGPGRPLSGHVRPDRFGRPGIIGGRPGYGAQNGVLVGPRGSNYDRRRDI